MSEREHRAAEAEARRTAPGLVRGRFGTRGASGGDMLLQYLHAAATAGGTTAPGRAAAPVRPAEPGTVHRELRVRDIMRRPVPGVPEDTPFLEVARTLAHGNLGAVTVVDAGGRVVGVVSESDLLAVAAGAGPSAGPLHPLRGRRLRRRAAAGTAGGLMTAPAVAVHPDTPVAEAARAAARSRLKRLPVTDHQGRLLGMVHRGDLLRCLVVDDAGLRREAAARVAGHGLAVGPGGVDVAVDRAVVTLRGEVGRELIPGLLAEVRDVDGVVDVVDRLTAV
ncbi:HPP family protein [Streptomyces sp. NPDC001380]|uniref:CBS domain-containing protein n=1 Tax=Streptomyces sp. NPDC001380 TaxID=3364566 RepID=UPI0036C81111